MLNCEATRTRPRIVRQLTGLTPASFRTLPAGFKRAYDDDRRPRDRWRPTPRPRRPGGGAKAVLSTPADELVSLLFCFRQDPTQETSASLFGVRRGQARRAAASR